MSGFVKNNIYVGVVDKGGNKLDSLKVKDSEIRVALSTFAARVFGGKENKYDYLLISNGIYDIPCRFEKFYVDEYSQIIVSVDEYSQIIVSVDAMERIYDYPRTVNSGELLFEAEFLYSGTSINTGKSESSHDLFIEKPTIIHSEPTGIYLHRFFYRSKVLTEGKTTGMSKTYYRA